MSRKLGWLVVALWMLAGCRGELHQQDGNVEVRLALTRDGLRLVEADEVGELPNPPVQGQALQFRFSGNDGDVVEGRIADARTLRSEFDRAGQPDPQTLKAEFGLVNVRVPTKAGLLALHDLDGTALGELALNADEAGVRRAPLMRDVDVLGPPVKVVDHGPSDTKVDILFLPEGYTESELGEFHAHVDFIVDQIKEHSGYREHWTGFNVWRQHVRSRTAGTGANGRPTDTAFETAAGIAGLERCVFFTNPEGQEAALRLAREAGADATVVLVNSTQYGGCAGEDIVVSARPRGVADIVGHELAHALFGLADEYESPHQDGYCSVGPNVSSSPDRRSLPWSDLVTANSLPTPPSADVRTVGAFEGAGYCATGRYRPTHNCMMRTLGAGMCPVCRREVARTMATLAPEPQVEVDRVTLVNAAGEAVWARCDGAASIACSDWVLIKPAESATLNATDRRVIIHSPDGSTLFSMRRATVPQDMATIYANPSDPFSEQVIDEPKVSAPAALSPDLARIETDTVELSWTHDADARYFVTIETETASGWSLYTTLEAYDTNAVVYLGGADTRYRWHVEACIEGGCVRSLQAVFDHYPQKGSTAGPDVATPARPRLVSPAHEEILPAGTVRLSWDAEGSSHIVNVRVYDETLGWLEHIHETDVVGSTLDIQLDTPDTWYAWTVTSCDANGACSPWAEYALVGTD